MAILDNANTPNPNSEVGIKVSKPGFSVQTAADFNLVFSSSWPSLAVAFTIQVPYTASNVVIPHGLKFPPFTMCWVVDTIQAAGSYTAPTKGAMRLFPDVDATNIYMYGGIGGGYFQSTSSVLHIKAFNIDLSKDVDYPLLSKGSGYQGGYDPNYGIKLAKSNKDVASRDLRDFILHSRAQTPLIMAVKTQKTMNPANSTTIQYTNKLGYPSWNYGFAKQNNGRYYYAPFFSQSYPKTTTDGITTYLPWANSDIGATLVILRDPLFPTNQIDVTY
jgi:hypothetical protein